MKQIKILAAAAFFMATATAGHAEGIYASGFGGLNILPSEEFTIGDGITVHIFDYKAGYTFGGAVGTRIAENIRAEFELSRFSADVDRLRVPEAPLTIDLTGDAQGTVGLANVWFDWENDSAISPYAGLGLGLGRVAMDTAEPGFGAILVGSETGLAAQAGAGLRLAASNSVTVDLGYRFKTVRNLGFFVPDLGADTTDFNLSMHQFQLGLTYQFD